MRCLICYDATWINKLAPAFRLPHFAKNAKEGAPTVLLMPVSFKGWATRLQCP